MADVIKTIGSGQDYTSLVSWLANWIKTASSFQGDNEITKIHGKVDETPGLRLEFDANKTSASQRIIVTNNGNRHEGKWDVTKDMSTSNVNYMRNRDNYVTFEDLQIWVPGVSNRTIFLHGSFDEPGEFIIRRNIISAVTADNVTGFSSSTTNSGMKWLVYRNIWIGTGDATSKAIQPASFSTPSSDSQFNNNTIHGWSVGMNLRDRTMTAKNNLIQSCTTCYTSMTNVTTSNNISEDATSPDPAYRNKVVTFVDEVNDDFHLDPGDTEAIDNGANLGSPFDLDIDGETAGDTWSIGADEIAATGGTNKCFMKSQLLNKSCFNALDSSVEVF